MPPSTLPYTFFNDFGESRAIGRHQVSLGKIVDTDTGAASDTSKLPEKSRFMFVIHASAIISESELAMNRRLTN